MALSDIIQPFVWGENGGRMTPEEIARQREIAASLLGVDTSPVGHWTQGAARMANALVGRVRESRADAASQQNAEDSKSRIASLLSGLGGGAGFPSAVAAGASPTSAAATGTSVAVPSAPEIRQGLIDRGLSPHVADAFILNFQDESGLNPGINEQNPTVPGSRGGFGLAQWTGPRRRGLEQFASQRGVDPSNTDAQLDFLMTELQGPEAKAAQSILNAPDTATAAQAIVNNFLRPAEEHRASRAARYGRVASTPQEAIEAIAPMNGASSQSPAVAPFDFTGNNDLSAASGMSFSPQGDVGSVPKTEGSTFNDRWNAGTASAPILPEQETPASMNILPEQAMSTVSNFQPSNTEQTVDPRLLALNDQMLGGALAPSGGSGVAQALTGYFPDAPSANRAPVTSAAPVASSSSTGGINPAIIEALSNPYASDQERSIAGLLLNQQMQQNDPIRALQAQKLQAEVAALQAKPTTKYGFQSLPDGTVLRTNEATGQAEPIYNAGSKPTSDIQNYEYARQRGFQGSFEDYQQSLKKAGSNSTVINNGKNSNKFVEKSDEAAAKRMDDIVASGQTAPQTMADMQQLLDLGSQIGTGKAAQAKAVLGPYAQALGIDIDGMGDIQAYQAITSRLAPQMRAVGSGSSSDRDVALFFQSLPNLGNTPGGNEIIANTMKSVAQNKMNAADIARRAQRGEITWQDADKQISELPNPYNLFKQFQKESQSGKSDNGGWQDMGNGVRIRRKQ